MRLIYDLELCLKESSLIFLVKSLKHPYPFRFTCKFSFKFHNIILETGAENKQLHQPERVILILFGYK